MEEGRGVFIPLKTSVEGGFFQMSVPGLAVRENSDMTGSQSKLICSAKGGKLS